MAKYSWVSPRTVALACRHGRFLSLCGSLETTVNGLLSLHKNLLAILVRKQELSPQDIE